MSEATDWLADELAALESAGWRRHRRTVTPLPNGECEIDGRRLINFASNDYLGLTGDKRLCEAARRALEDTGAGAGASALVSGRTVWHERLEQRLAEFEGTESALLFPTGYAANVGTLAALAGRGDVVFSDQLNHASLIDGCRLSRATVCVYPHRDVDRLADELNRHRDARRRLIVTDGVFSMDGDVAPLAELSNLAKIHGAMLLVDEAHGTGVLGERGRGACEALGVDGPHLIRVGTLSKAMGAVGGFVAGPLELIEFLWNRARTQIFSTAMPPALCAAACTALDILRDEPQRRRHLRDLSSRLRNALSWGGVPVPLSDETPIVPVVVGQADAAVRMAAELARHGLFVPAIRPPTVPDGTSRLRISLSAAHSPAAIEQFADRLICAFTSGRCEP
ncbi:MAG: 8-amino-7-oxononanoate synthase [Planctomycetaceae bacterium]